MALQRPLKLRFILTSNTSLSNTLSEVVIILFPEVEEPIEVEVVIPLAEAVLEAGPE